MDRHTPTAAVIALLALIASPVLGQDDASPLGGPDIPDEETRTIVEGSMNARFQQVDGHPAVAAARRLELDAATRARVDAIVADRETRLVLMLVDEIDTIREMTDLSTEGDAEGARQLLREMQERFDPETPRDPMLGEIKAALSPEQGEQLQQMVDKYWDAWVRWTLRERLAREAAQQKLEDQDGEPDPGDAMMAPEQIAQPEIAPRLRERTERRLAFQIFQRETRATYENSLRAYQQALEGIYAAVEPTPTQREAIRTTVIEHIKRTRLSPTPTERRETYRKLYDLLDEERKGKLFDYLVAQVIPE